MTALGVAVAALLLCWIPIVNNVTFFLGVVGLILGVIAHVRARRGRAEGRGMAFASILIAILSLAGVIVTQIYYESLLTDLEQAVTGDSESEPTGSDDETPKSPPLLDLGKSAKVGLYSVAITKVNLDADRIVARTNEFNEPPKGRYIIATFEVTYTGDEEGNPWTDLQSTFVGSDARQYDAYDCDSVVPDDVSEAPTLNNGGQATFKDCFDVPPAAIKGGRLYVQDTTSFDDSGRRYWAIR